MKAGGGGEGGGGILGDGEITGFITSCRSVIGSFASGPSANGKHCDKDVT